MRDIAEQLVIVVVPAILVLLDTLGLLDIQVMLDSHLGGKAED